MEYLIAIVLGVVGSLLAAEFYANAPWLSAHLIDRAALHTPERERARYREEWQAHLDDCPGNIGKLLHALNCYFFASRGVSRALQRPSQRRASNSSVGRAQRPAIDRYRIKLAFWLNEQSHDRIMFWERWMVALSRQILRSGRLFVRCFEIYADALNALLKRLLGP